MNCMCPSSVDSFIQCCFILFSDIFIFSTFYYSVPLMCRFLYLVVDGELHMWGKNSNGQLGLGKSNGQTISYFFILYPLFHKPQFLKILDHDNNLAYILEVSFGPLYFILLSYLFNYSELTFAVVLLRQKFSIQKIIFIFYDFLGLLLSCWEFYFFIYF